LPIIYLESDAYRADGELEDKIIGDSEDVLGSSEDKATNGLRAILGNPLQQVRSVEPLRVARLGSVEPLRVVRLVRRGQHD
jgi:hypothetical protein